MRIGWKGSFAVGGCRKNTHRQKMILYPLIVILQCFHFAITVKDEALVHVVSPSVDASAGIGSTRQVGLFDDSAGREKGSLLLGGRDPKNLLGGKNKNQHGILASSAIPKEYPPLNNKELITTDRSISNFAKAYDKFKSDSTMSLKLDRERHQTEEKNQHWHVAWGDRLVRQMQMERGRVNLHRLHEKVKEVADHKIRREMKTTLDLVGQELKSKDWWTRIVSFIRYVFKRDKWKQDEATLKLGKLRRGFKDGSTPPDEKTQRAIGLLSIFTRKGPNFSKEELQLIQNMSQGSSHLTTADHALIDKLSKGNYLGHVNMKVQKLVENYTSAMDQTPEEMKKTIYRVLHYYRAMTELGKRWDEQDRKLFEELEKMKDMNDAYQSLVQNKTQKKNIIRCAWKFRLLENQVICANAYAMLKSKSNIPVEETEVLEKLNTYWNEGMLSTHSDHGAIIWNFYQDHSEIIEKNDKEFKQKMQEFLKKSQPIDEFQSNLHQISSIEESVRRTEKEKKYIAWENIKNRASSMTEKESKQLEKLTSNSKMKKGQINMIDKLDIELRIIDNVQVSTDLMKITRGLIENDESLFKDCENKFHELIRYLRPEEKGVIEGLLKLSGDHHKFEKETKFVKILKMLINVDCRSQFDTGGVEEVINILNTIAELKNYENNVAKLKFKKSQDYFQMWKQNYT